MLKKYWIIEYPESRIKQAILILHPKIFEKYEITLEEFYDVFECWSNFTKLKNPIID